MLAAIARKNRTQLERLVLLWEEGHREHNVRIEARHTPAESSIAFTWAGVQAGVRDLHISIAHDLHVPAERRHLDLRHINDRDLLGDLRTRSVGHRQTVGTNIQAINEVLEGLTVAPTQGVGGLPPVKPYFDPSVVVAALLVPRMQFHRQRYGVNSTGQRQKQCAEDRSHGAIV